MKKLIICLITAITVSFLATKAVIAGGSPTKTLGTGASVTDAAPEIDIAVLKFENVVPNKTNPWANGVLLSGTPSLDFGPLVHTYTDTAGVTQEAGVWYSKTSYLVYVYSQSFGKRYQITSTCAGLGSIPANAFVLTPFYSDGDKYKLPDGSFSPSQGAMPSGATVGPAGSAVGTNLTIYQSESPGTARILQAWYSIPTKDANGNAPYAGWTGVPLTQTPGNYSGSVTVSISAI